MKGALTRFGAWYVDRRVSAGLDGVWVRGLERLQTAAASGPIVVACTHQSWWDGMVSVWLCRQLGLRPTIMMRADNLERWPFFEMFGAVGVRGARGVRACLDRLEGPGDVLWTFPQGCYRPAEARPLGLKRGASWAAKQAGAPLVPIALGYGFDERPEVRAYLSVGEPVRPDTELEPALVRGLEQIASREGFSPLFTPAPLEPGLASQVLGRLWRMV